MRKEAIELEEKRFYGININGIQDYPCFHEKHRIFPEIFEDRGHKKILDIAAGIGIVGKRIYDNYKTAELLCNDIAPVCLKTMQNVGLQTISFDIDDDENAFPFSDDHFDAIIALATIEHLNCTGHFLKEIRRILRNNTGYLYISAPNYSGLPYLILFLLTGRTFHNPMSKFGTDYYEFFAHVKYFTYHTLLEFVSSFGFTPVAVYLAAPENGSRYKMLKAKSKFKALGFQLAMKFIYHSFSPRWASEPVICFQKSNSSKNGHKVRKVVM